MAVLTAAQQAIITKLSAMSSMPAVIAWGSPVDVGDMALGFSGSRSQETAARQTYARFIAMGGQAELDRLRRLVMTEPALNAAWSSQIAAGNRGDWFSRIGDTVVSAVPLALTVAAMAAGADLLMGGTLFTATASGASAATGASTAAQAASAAAYNPIAAMTGAGGGGSDAAVAAAAASAPGVASAAVASAEMAAAQWGTLATGAGQAASTGFSLIDAARNLPINKG